MVVCNIILGSKHLCHNMAFKNVMLVNPGCRHYEDSGVQNLIGTTCGDELDPWFQLMIESICLVLIVDFESFEKPHTTKDVLIQVQPVQHLQFNYICIHNCTIL